MNDGRKRNFIAYGYRNPWRIVLLAFCCVPVALAEEAKPTGDLKDADSKPAQHADSEKKDTPSETRPSGEQGDPDGKRDKDDKDDTDEKDIKDEGAPCRGADAAELKILTSLRERHEELDERERRLVTRENAFATQQQKLSAKVDALSASLADLEKKLEIGEPGRKAKEERLGALVTAIDSLSAKKAAPMLSEADPHLAGEILRRVGPTRTAALLAVMPTAKAARLLNQVGADSIPSSASSPSPASGVKP